MKMERPFNFAIYSDHRSVGMQFYALTYEWPFILLAYNGTIGLITLCLVPLAFFIIPRAFYCARNAKNARKT